MKVHILMLYKFLAVLNFIFAKMTNVFSFDFDKNKFTKMTIFWMEFMLAFQMKRLISFKDKHLVLLNYTMTNFAIIRMIGRRL